MKEEKIRVNVRYMGGVDFLIGVDAEEFSLEEGSTLDKLVKEIEKKHENKDLKISGRHFSAYNSAKNQIYNLKRAKKFELEDGDEISFFMILYGG